MCLQNKKHRSCEGVETVNIGVSTGLERILHTFYTFMKKCKSFIKSPSGVRPFPFLVFRNYLSWYEYDQSPCHTHEQTLFLPMSVVSFNATVTMRHPHYPYEGGHGQHECQDQDYTKDHGQGHGNPSKTS